MIRHIINFFSNIERNITILKFEKEERRSHIQVIQRLIDESKRRYGDNFNSELLYIEEALRKANIREADEDEYEDGSVLITCPTCHSIVYKSQNYCSHCGQRITFRRKTC